MTDSHVLSAIADLKSRMVNLENTVLNLDRRLADIETPEPRPVVEPTGYEGMHSTELLHKFTDHVEIVYPSRDVMADRENMRREILIRMQQGSGE